MFWSLESSAGEFVALRKESVDRNFVSAFDVLAISAVALRKESVDRNMLNIGTLRRTHVALRKESVDRNKIRITTIDSISSRSPQGERG